MGCRCQQSLNHAIGSSHRATGGSAVVSLPPLEKPLQRVRTFCGSRKSSHRPRTWIRAWTSSHPSLSVRPRFFVRDVARRPWVRHVTGCSDGSAELQAISIAASLGYCIWIVGSILLLSRRVLFPDAMHSAYRQISPVLSCHQAVKRDVFVVVQSGCSSTLDHRFSCYGKEREREREISLSVLLTTRPASRSSSFLEVLNITRSSRKRYQLWLNWFLVSLVLVSYVMPTIRCLCCF